MWKVIDLIGQKFGRLTVINRAENYVPPSKKKKVARWECQCECGNEVIVRGDALRSGLIKSCGCFKKDFAYGLGKGCATHKQTKTRLYNIWGKMKSRCYKTSNNRYKNYGGRGITVCDEWKDDFPAFYEWAMANGYADNLSIDRIDNNGNYCPSNCRWISLSENAKKSHKDRMYKQ